MKLRKRKYLFDVNVLVALVDEEHIHHKKVMTWFDSSGKHDWGVCGFTEAGFLRIMTNPKAGSESIEDATEMLRQITRYPGYKFWPTSESWVSCIAPFAGRLFGHQQVTDAYLLGMAIREKGVLVTLDKAIKTMAGIQYQDHVLLLE